MFTFSNLLRSSSYISPFSLSHYQQCNCLHLLVSRTLLASSWINEYMINETFIYWKKITPAAELKLTKLDVHSELLKPAYVETPLIVSARYAATKWAACSNVCPRRTFRYNSLTMHQKRIFRSVDTFLQLTSQFQYWIALSN